jgi:hypothetical protein
MSVVAQVVYLGATRVKYGFQEYMPSADGVPVIYRTETISGSIAGVDVSGVHGFVSVTEVSPFFGPDIYFDIDGVNYAPASTGSPDSVSCSGFAYSTTYDSEVPETARFLPYREPWIWRTWNIPGTSATRPPAGIYGSEGSPLWIAAPWTQKSWTGLPLVSETATVRTWSDGTDTVTATLADEISTTDLVGEAASLISAGVRGGAFGSYSGVYNLVSGPEIIPFWSGWLLVAVDYLAPDETIVINHKSKVSYFCQAEYEGDPFHIWKHVTNLETGEVTKTQLSISPNSKGYTAFETITADPQTMVHLEAQIPFSP